MQLPDSKADKHKRILIYWDELSKLEVRSDAALHFMSYTFSVSEVYIMKVIKHDISEFEHIYLPFLDLDIKNIGNYYKDKYIKVKNMSKASNTKPINPIINQKELF